MFGIQKLPNGRPNTNVREGFIFACMFGNFGIKSTSAGSLARPSLCTFNAEIAIRSVKLPNVR